MKPVKETWSAFDRFQKAVLCVLAAMVLLFGVLQTASAFRRGVVFGNGLLDVEQTGETTIYTGKSYGEPVEVTVRKVSDTLTEITFVIGSVIHDVCTLETGLPPFTNEHGEQITDTFRVEKNGVVLFDGGYAENRNHGRYHRDGSWESPVSVSASTAGQGYWETNEISLGNINYFARGSKPVTRGSWLLFALTTLLALLAAAEAAFPLQLFRLRHRWYVQDPEPTEFYYSMTRLSCVLVSIFVLISYIFALRQLP